MTESENPTALAHLSKRRARRLIQRAFVLAGRDRRLRQHVREARLTTVWSLEDWGLAWTLALDRGRIEFDRRVAKHPDLRLGWGSAADFFDPVQHGARVEIDGDTDLRRKFLAPLLRSFHAAWREVLQNPVDEDGDPLW